MLVNWLLRLTAELAILEHMSKMKDRGLEEKPSTPAKKPTQDKPVMFI